MTGEEHYGDCRDRGSVSADFSLRYGEPRLQLVNPTTGGVDCILPNALGLPLGGPHFVIVNTNGAAVGLTLKNALPFTLTSIAAGRAAKVWLYDNTTTFGLWIVRLIDKRN